MKIDKTKTPDDVYANLPESERITALILRELIFEAIPGITEKLSWGAPFYFAEKSICFVWPASVPWGKMKEGVALGFTRADRLDHEGYLTIAQGQSIGRRIFYTPEEIDIMRVKKLLLRAWREREDSWT